MDEVDLAAEQTELWLAESLRLARQPPQIETEWACLNCDADLASRKQRFCDAYCAADWQRRSEAIRKQHGGRA